MANACTVSPPYVFMISHPELVAASIVVQCSVPDV
jgi:hypothetical protein